MSARFMNNQWVLLRWTLSPSLSLTVLGTFLYDSLAWSLSFLLCSPLVLGWFTWPHRISLHNHHHWIITIISLKLPHSMIIRGSAITAIAGVFLLTFVSRIVLSILVIRYGPYKCLFPFPSAAVKRQRLGSFAKVLFTEYFRARARRQRHFMEIFGISSLSSLIIARGSCGSCDYNLLFQHVVL